VSVDVFAPHPCGEAFLALVRLQLRTGRAARNRRETPARPPKTCPQQEEVLRCTRQGSTTKTFPRALGRAGLTITRAATGVPPDAAERRDPYPP
jgi:hypothetical protein